MNPRRPRIRDPKYLSWLRTKPCCICGAKSEACHIRSGSPENDKPPTGYGEKPSDKWALPMCREHHREQHGMNELRFWQTKGIDPFVLAKRYFYQAVTGGFSSPTTKKPKSRVVIQSRGFPKVQRKIPSRKFGQ